MAALEQLVAIRMRDKTGTGSEDFCVMLDTGKVILRIDGKLAVVKASDAARLLADHKFLERASGKDADEAIERDKDSIYGNLARAYGDIDAALERSKRVLDEARAEYDKLAAISARVREAKDQGRKGGDADEEKPQPKRADVRHASLSQTRGAGVKY